MPVQAQTLVGADEEEEEEEEAKANSHATVKAKAKANGKAKAHTTKTNANTQFGPTTEAAGATTATSTTPIRRTVAGYISRSMQLCDASSAAFVFAGCNHC